MAVHTFTYLRSIGFSGTLAQMADQLRRDTTKKWQYDVPLDELLDGIERALPSTGTLALQASQGLLASGAWIDPVSASYGADPTGSRDSAPAWRAAAIAAQSSGTPIIPSPGTYLFSSKDAATDVFVPLTAGIRIQPRALGDVTIKIANSVSTWVTVFGTPAMSIVDLSGLDIRNLIVDGDSANNAYPSVPTPRRYLVRASAGSGIRFVNNRVINWDGRNVVSFNGSNGIAMSDITITDNEFIGMGGPVYHDSSTVFCLADNFIVARNKLRGVDLGPTTPNNCMAAFDMHGSNYQIKDNYAENYAMCSTVCGPDPGSTLTSGYEITGNIFRGVGRGFAFFAYTKMHEGLIANNIIAIDMDRWPATAPGGYNASPTGEGYTRTGFAHPAFVRIQGTSPIVVGEALINWKIQDNHFSWTGSPGLSGDTCYLMGNNQDHTSVPDENIVSKGNTFLNCPSNYLFAYGFGTLQGWLMDDIVINPGSSELGTSYQSLYRFRNGTAINNCHFGGRFTDDKAGATSRITRWLLQDTGTGDTVPTFTNVDMDGIRVTVAATTSPAMVSVQAGQVIRCSTTVQGWVAPTGNAAFTAGSTITEMSTGQARTQTALPAGATFGRIATADEGTLTFPADIQASQDSRIVAMLQAAGIHYGDPMLSSGSLVLIEPGHPNNPFSGVPADGASILNIAWEQSAALVGSGDVNTPVGTFATTDLTGSYGLVERSTKGGLHVITSQTSLPTAHFARIDLSTLIKTYLLANPTNDLFVSMWANTTRAAVPQTATIHRRFQISSIATPTIYRTTFWTPAAGENTAAIGTYPRNGTDTAYWMGSYVTPFTDTPSGLGAKRWALSTNDWVGTPPILSDLSAATVWGYPGSPGYLIANPPVAPSWILYRIYIEDMTVSGRSWSTLNNLDSAQFSKEVLTGSGRYYGDTFTDPATIP